MCTSQPTGVLWRHAGFMRLWAAQAISAFGARIAREGIPLAAVLTVHAAPLQLGILAAIAMSPGPIVGLFVGGIVDRSGKRNIMVASDLLRTAVLSTVPFAAWSGMLTMAQLYLVAFLIGGASVLFDIADHAFLPNLISRSSLVEGNAKLGTTEAIAEIAGPVVTGILVQLFAAPFALALNAITYIGSAGLLLTIPGVETPKAPNERSTWQADIAAGIRAVVADAIVRPLSVLAIFSPFFGMFFGALYALYALRVLGFSPSLLGVTIAVGGIGSLCGAAIAQPLIRSLGSGPAMVVATVGSAVSAVLIPLAAGPLAVRAAMMMASQLAGDMFGTAAIIVAVSIRQTILPPDMLGRTAAVLKAGAGISAILGALTAGVLAGSLGIRPTLLVAATGYGLTPLVAILSPLIRLKELPAELPSID